MIEPLSATVPNLLTRSRTREVAGNISDTTLKRLMNEEGFPRPANIGRRTVWVEEEVAEWLTRQIESRAQRGVVG